MSDGTRITVSLDVDYGNGNRKHLSSASKLTG